MNDRTVFRLLLSTFVLCPNLLVAQVGCGNENYGKFCLSFPYGSHLSFILYRTPKADAKPQATLEIYDRQTGPNSYVTGASTLYYYVNKHRVDLLAVFDLEYTSRLGIAGIAYSPDSQWVMVSLDFHRFADSTFFWLRTTDTKNSGVSITQWHQFLMEHSNLHFRCESEMRFYAEPSLSTPAFPSISIKKYKRTQSLDYSLKPIQVSGEWMQVYLYSPSSFGHSDQSIKARNDSSNPPPKLWIQYLYQDGSPKVWFWSD